MIRFSLGSTLVRRSRDASLALAIFALTGCAADATENIEVASHSSALAAPPSYMTDRPAIDLGESSGVGEIAVEDNSGAGSGCTQTPTGTTCGLPPQQIEGVWVCREVRCTWNGTKNVCKEYATPGCGPSN